MLFNGKYLPMFKIFVTPLTNLITSGYFWHSFAECFLCFITNQSLCVLQTIVLYHKRYPFDAFPFYFCQNNLPNIFELNFQRFLTFFF